MSDEPCSLGGDDHCQSTEHRAEIGFISTRCSNAQRISVQKSLDPQNRAWKKGDLIIKTSYIVYNRKRGFESWSQFNSKFLFVLPWQNTWDVRRSDLLNLYEGEIHVSLSRVNLFLTVTENRTRHTRCSFKSFPGFPRFLLYVSQGGPGKCCREHVGM